MKTRGTFILVFLFLGFISRELNGQNPSIPFELSEEVKEKLRKKIDRIDELDGKYRSMLQLGTLDESLLKREKELSKKGDMKAYIAFTKTITKTITQAQEDSLNLLQDQLDQQNQQQIKSIIQKYGYPSGKRLGVESDKITPILLHFPMDVKPDEYLENMTRLLMPEVKAKRMEAISFARFYDNIMTRFLNKPQVYGTVKKFNMKTMTPGLPAIGDINKTNELRKEIGLKGLKEGEYEILE